MPSIDALRESNRESGFALGREARFDGRRGLRANWQKTVEVVQQLADRNRHSN